MHQLDPLADLRARFIARSRERISSLRALIDAGAGEASSVAAIARLAHQLAGAAGTFGYAALGETAATLEDRARGATGGASAVESLSFASILEKLEAQVGELEAKAARPSAV